MLGKDNILSLLLSFLPSSYQRTFTRIWRYFAVVILWESSDKGCIESEVGLANCPGGASIRLRIAFE